MSWEPGLFPRLVSYTCRPGWGGGCKAGPQVPCSLGRRSVGGVLLPGCVGVLLGFGLGTNENAFFGMGVIGRQ